MKKTNLFALTIAKVALIAVKEASGTASWYGSYQPKEPKKLKDYISKRKIKWILFAGGMDYDSIIKTTSVFLLSL